MYNIFYSCSCKWTLMLQVYYDMIQNVTNIVYRNQATNIKVSKIKKRYVTEIHCHMCPIFFEYLLYIQHRYCSYMQPLLFETFKRHSKAKGRISKRVFQEKKAREIFRKTNIFYPLICTRTCTYQGVKNVRFSENFTCFLFLKHPFWDSPFCLITDEFLYLIVKIMYDKSLIYNKWFFYLKKNNVRCAKYSEFVFLVNSQNSNSVTSSLTSLSTRS